MTAHNVIEVSRRRMLWWNIWDGNIRQLCSSMGLTYKKTNTYDNVFKFNFNTKNLVMFGAIL